jgi:hypothetical protein
LLVGSRSGWDSSLYPRPLGVGGFLNFRRFVVPLELMVALIRVERGDRMAMPRLIRIVDSSAGRFDTIRVCRRRREIARGRGVDPFATYSTNDVPPVDPGRRRRYEYYNPSSMVKFGKGGCGEPAAEPAPPANTSDPLCYKISDRFFDKIWGTNDALLISATELPPWRRYFFRIK